MGSHVRPAVSFFETVKLILAVVYQVILALKDALPPATQYQSGPFRRRLGVAYVRHMFALSAEQRRMLAETSGEAVASYCKASRLPFKSVPIGGAVPATLHYINCTETSPGRQMLYIHGGGYVEPVSAIGQIPFVGKCANAAKASLVVLEYCLAPEHKYPTQLLQAAEALNYMLRFRSAEDIVIIGDSAGGHLALSLLAHVQVSHPEARKIDLKGHEFAGVCLISPWVGLEYTANSYEENVNTDFLTSGVMHDVTNKLNPVRDDIWSNFTDPTHDWIGFPVKKVMIAGGSWEVFADDIKAFAKNLTADEANRRKTELVICPQEVHVNCILDCAVGYEGGIMSTSILKWCSILD